MRKCVLHVALLAVALLAGFSIGHLRAFGQAADSGGPIFGTWKMDQTKSVNNRGGNHAPYPTQHTRILAPEGGGLRNTLAYNPNSSPVYSYSGEFDGKDHPDPRAAGQDRTLAHWRIAPDLIVRLQKDKGIPTEWVIYTVSSDGKVFTSISWVPTNPELQDLQVFMRAN
jgi:hypothetical protein